jgi:hypothetical protein
MNFYCRSYCLLSMFKAPFCPSSGAREYYTSGCCLSYLVLGFEVVGMLCRWGLGVRFEGSSPQTRHTILEFLMMGIMGPETCWASNKIRNKSSSVSSSWQFISTYYVLLCSISIANRCSATAPHRTAPHRIAQKKKHVAFGKTLRCNNRPCARLHLKQNVSLQR